MNFSPGSGEVVRSGSTQKLRAQARSRDQVLLVGMFGCGNLGNEASLSVMLDSIRSSDPSLRPLVLADDPNRVRAEHGVDSQGMQWQSSRLPRLVPGIIAKLLAKGVDIFRIAGHVRQSRCVIVPGTGIFEALGVFAWGVPWVLFLVATLGRLFRVPVAFVNVGAEVIDDRWSRVFLMGAIRMATHVSFRDELSLRSTEEMIGHRLPDHRVVADIVFAKDYAPVGRPSADVTRQSQVVAVGVMAWFGTRDRPSDDGGRYDRYTTKMMDIVVHLIDNEVSVRLVIGDKVDQATANLIRDGVISVRPSAEQSDLVTVHSANDLNELVCTFADVDMVIATRYHNVIAALLVDCPVISIGYAEKNRELLEEFGIGEFAQDIDGLDVDRLKAQAAGIRSNRSAITRSIVAHRQRLRRAVCDQLPVLLAGLLGPAPMRRED